MAQGQHTIQKPESRAGASIVAAEQLRRRARWCPADGPCRARAKTLSTARLRTFCTAALRADNAVETRNCD